jgi:hypothetical protein
MMVALWAFYPGCSSKSADEPDEYHNASEVALAWNQLALDLERHTKGFRPPVTARMFAYVEMAAYEAALPGMPGHMSLEIYFNGYKRPDSNPPADPYYVPAGINAAYAQMLRNFFPAAPPHLQEKIDGLERRYLQDSKRHVTAEQAEQSAAYGKKVAENVWNWAKSDEIGHAGHLSNYDHDYQPPVCKGCWLPAADHPAPALLPYWGRVRPFFPAHTDINLKAPMGYAEAPGTDFYAEAMEVFSVSKPLSKENIWIAEFWSDDFPGLTLTPTGRWISIANQAFEKAQPPFPLLMETYLKLSVALCDAGILVWQGKYHYNLERPETFIRQHIDASWKALHDTPPFPAYPSGHAAFGAAAAEVLTDALGGSFQMTDRTHENRPEFESAPRTYASFEEMAQENAASRVLLGVHYRMDCEEGMRLGKIIGQKMAALPLQRREAGLPGK